MLGLLVGATTSVLVLVFSKMSEVILFVLFQRLGSVWPGLLYGHLVPSSPTFSEPSRFTTIAMSLKYTSIILTSTLIPSGSLVVVLLLYCIFYKGDVTVQSKKLGIVYRYLRLTILPRCTTLLRDLAAAVVGR